MIDSDGLIQTPAVKVFKAKQMALIASDHNNLMTPYSSYTLTALDTIQ